MREIKFRAWDKQTRNWCELYTVDNAVEWYNRKHSIFRGFFDRHIILMQYTGLKDKNGKEIYEGDIIDKSYTNPLNGELVIQRYIIKWHNGMYKAVFIKDKPYYDRCLWMEYKDTEVIGNVFDNPELLEANHE